jgi:RNA polymerase sigma-70 factor (ECF subfamily)
VTELDAALDDARGGGEWGKTLLYRILNPSLLRYLRHHVHGVAEDLASECWVAAVQGLSTFQGDANDFRAWLFTVARRRVADHYRQQGRRPKVVSLETATEPVAADDPADAAIAGLSAQQAIELLTRELSPDQAEVILLRVVSELSVEQVARIMERSPGSVRVLQHRALRRLQKIFDKVVTN